MFRVGSPTRFEVYSLVAIRRGFVQHTPVHSRLAHMVGSLQSGQLPVRWAEKVLQVFHYAEAQPFLSGTFQKYF